MKKALIFVLFLAACKVEPQPRVWDDFLDPYMASYGYTIANDGKTILKNGYPVWVDEPCFSRGCVGNYSLVPSELREGVRMHFLEVYDKSRKQYVADISDKIGVEPVEPKKEEE